MEGLALSLILVGTPVLLVIGLLAGLVAVGAFTAVQTRMSALEAQIRKLIPLRAEVEALTARLATAEKRLAEGPAAPSLSPSLAPEPAVTPSVVPSPLSAASSTPPASIAAPTTSARLTALARPPAPPRPPFVMPSIERVAAVFAATIGGFTLILGFILFVGVALSRGWIGPGARMLFAFAGTSGLWVTGDLLRKRSPWVASALAGAGFVGVLSAIYATHAAYGFLGSTATTVFMVASCAVAGAAAAKWNDRVAAHLSLVGALMTPVLLATGENKAVAFFLYLALVTAGTVGTAAFKGWIDLILTAAIGVGLLHLGWTMSWHAADQAPIALIAVGLLMTPFVAASAFGKSPAREGALVVVVVFPLLVAPLWLIPIDPLFTDPHTYAVIAQPFAGLPWLQALAIPLLAAPLWVLGRVRGWWALSATGLLSATLLWSAFAIGWVGTWSGVGGAATIFAASPLLFGAAWLIAVPTVLQFAGKPSSHGIAPLPLVGGVALSLGILVVGATPVGDWLSRAPLGLLVAAATGGLLVAGGMNARPRGTTAALPFLSIGVGVLLLAGSVAKLPQIGLPWVFQNYVPNGGNYTSFPAWSAWSVPTTGPALLALFAVGILPLIVKWNADDRAWGLSSAAIAPVAIGPALIVQWLLFVGRDGVGVVPLGLGALAAAGAAAVVRVHGAQRSQLTPAIFVIVALTGVNLAIPLELRDGWLSVALALEVAAVAWVGGRFTHPVVRGLAGPVAVAVAVRLLFNPWALGYHTGGWPILNWTLYTWGVPTAAIALSAVLFRRSTAMIAAKNHLPLESWAPTFLGLLAVALGFALINVQVSQAFQPEGQLSLMGQGLLQGMVRSLSWGAYGIFILALGWVGHSRWLRLVGFAVVLLATAKVFLVDLWALSGFVRVGSLIGLGFFLIVAALLFERLVLRESKAEEATK